MSDLVEQANRLVEFKEFLTEDSDLLEEFMAREDIEDLLAAIGMAEAWVAEVINLTPEGERRILEALRVADEDFGYSESEEHEEVEEDMDDE